MQRLLVSSTLAIVGTSIILVGITFGAIGSVTKSALSIENTVTGVQGKRVLGTSTYAYIGLVEFRSTDSSDGHFQANIGFRNPFR